jgi:hypothetical protein
MIAISFEGGIFALQAVDSDLCVDITCSLGPGVDGPSKRWDLRHVPSAGRHAHNQPSAKNAAAAAICNFTPQLARVWPVSEYHTAHLAFS